jgi:hypothetical protein
MKGALKPLSSIRDIWAVRDEDLAKKTGIDVEDAKLAALSISPGWEILKEHIEGLKDNLDKRLTESVLGTLGDKQVGQDVMFAVLGKELLTSIINKVEDSAEQVDEKETTGK